MDRNHRRTFISHLICFIVQNSMVNMTGNTKKKKKKKKKKREADGNENCSWLFIEWTMVDLSLMFERFERRWSRRRGLNCTLLPKQRIKQKRRKRKTAEKVNDATRSCPNWSQKTSWKKIDICDADDESHRQFDIRLFSCNTTSFFFTVPSSPSSLLLYCLICCFSERNGDVVLDISFSSLQFHCATSSVFYQPEYDHYFD